MGSVDAAFQAQAVVGHGIFRDRPLIAVIGSCLEFPKRNLEVLRDDLEGVEVVRYASLRELKASIAKDDLRVHLLVVPEQRALDLVERPDAYRNLVGTGRIVFAYDTPESVEALRRGVLAEQISFMPMRCLSEVWSAFVRLSCFGEYVVPTEILTSQKPKDVEPVTCEAPSAARPSGNSFGLTPREEQILALVAEGMKNREVGQALGLSEHTVKLHLHNTFTKLGVTNRVSAAARYLAAVSDGRD